MVVAWTLSAIKHGSIKCQIEHCNPCKQPTERFAERKRHREKLLSLWLNSVADDLDLITDWWFFYRMFEMYGIEWADGDMSSRGTLMLLVFCAIGTLSYLLELYQAIFKYPQTFRWLAPFTILLEDVPQIILSILLSREFDSVSSFISDATPLTVFNISTSLYSALIKISGEVFVNYCYCCKFTPPDTDDDEE